MATSGMTIAERVDRLEQMERIQQMEGHIEKTKMALILAVKGTLLKFGLSKGSLIAVIILLSTSIFAAALGIVFTMNEKCTPTYNMLPADWTNDQSSIQSELIRKEIFRNLKSSEEVFLCLTQEPFLESSFREMGKVVLDGIASGLETTTTPFVQSTQDVDSKLNALSDEANDIANTIIGTTSSVIGSTVGFAETAMRDSVPEALRSIKLPGTDFSIDALIDDLFANGRSTLDTATSTVSGASEVPKANLVDAIPEIIKNPREALNDIAESVDLLKLRPAWRTCVAPGLSCEDYSNDDRCGIERGAGCDSTIPCKALISYKTITCPKNKLATFGAAFGYFTTIKLGLSIIVVMLYQKFCGASDESKEREEAESI